MRFFYQVSCVGIGAILLIFCSTAFSRSIIQTDMPAQCNNDHFLNDRAALQRQFLFHRTMYGQHINTPEHICGQVIKVFRPRKTRSGWHGYFLMKVGTGAPIRVVSNLDEMKAPAWPWVKKTDQVEVQGRYYYDGPHRQGIDWTHHGTSRSWPWDGFVTVNHQHYQ